jgi:hypothetical protein
MTEFGKLDAEGNYEKIRDLPQSAMMACPHFIMVPEHYREDNSCRCDDPKHIEMKDWGYTWKDGRWS